MEAQKTKTEKHSRPPAKLTWSTRLKYMFVRGWLVAIVKLTGLNGLYAFAHFFGTCEYLLQGKKSKRVHDRLSAIFGKPLPKKEARRIARSQMCRIRCDKTIYTIIDYINHDELMKRFTIVGGEHFDRSVERGKGTFFMSSHQGSQYLCAILFAIAGYSVIGLRDPKESLLKRYIQQQAGKRFPEFNNFKFIGNDGFARAFFRSFKNNEIIGAAMDVMRNRGNVRTVEVDFFGQKHHFVSGMTEIALRSKAVLLMGFIISCPNYHYKVVFYPWLVDPDKADASEETIQKVMQDYAHTIENHLKKYPDHISKTN